MSHNNHNGGPGSGVAVPSRNFGAHTLPMTNRSKVGGGQRWGAKSAMGGSFAPSHCSSSFFTRHNPHPARVRHIEGLLGVPICHVSDDGFQHNPRPMQTPERRSIYEAYKVPSSVSEHPIYPTNSYGISDYNVFATKGVPSRRAPQVPRWYDELKNISYNAGLQPGVQGNQPQQNNVRTTAEYSKKTGRMNEAPSRAMTRSGPASRAGRGLQSRSGMATGAVNKAADNDAFVIELLSQILQTDSLDAIQHWLATAPERDQSIVTDMIRAALTTDNQQSSYDCFLHNQNLNSTNAAAAAATGNVDRLVIEENQQPQQQQPSQDNKLPDINKTGNITGFVDQMNMALNQNHGFQPMASVAENNEESVVEYHMDNYANDDHHQH